MQVQQALLSALTATVGRRRADRIARFYRDRVLLGAETLTYALDPRGRESRRALDTFANRFAGERCFIIGNGPSLQRTNLGRLRNEYTFGLNRGYLLFDKIGGPTTFLVAVNDHVVAQFGSELEAAGPPLFASWRSRRFVPRHGRTNFIRRGPTFTFSSNLATQGAWEGATVTYVAMQLAFHMGFREIILVGVDHSFTTTGTPNKLVTSTGDDPNHFDPRYFGTGVRWQLPDLEMSEIAYRIARDHFDAHNRKILDATVGGHLTVFPKVNLDQV